MSALSISFAEARAAGACASAYLALRKRYRDAGDDHRVPLTKVMEVCGLYDTLWGVAALGERALLAELACDFAHRVAHLAGDAEPVCRTGIRVARLHVRGLASVSELGSVIRAALKAREGADGLAAMYSAESARHAAGCAGFRCSASADDPWRAARDATFFAANAKAASGDWGAAWDAECQWQTSVVREAVTTGRVPAWAWEVTR